MGHKHSREQILAGALEVATEAGLSQLTFGRVAKQLGISDRIVVYYLPTKEDLISEVLLLVGLQLQVVLARAFTAVAPDHLELARAVWPVLARPEIDPLFSLFFEANGLAAVGREPYATLVAQLVHAWIEWLAEFLEGTAHQRRTEAEAAIAMIDGLLLLRQLGGAAAANRAAGRFGIR